MPQDRVQEVVEPTIILVAKYPAAGYAKSRLAADIGEKNAAKIARACLEDLLIKIGCMELSPAIQRWLLFSPSESHDDMLQLLRGCGMESQWILLPAAPLNRFKSVDLGTILSDAMSQVRSLRSGPIVFIGMDTPHLKVMEIEEALRITLNGNAYICPAEDGGYVLLGLPQGCSSTVFGPSIAWSSKDTCDMQIQCLKDAGVGYLIGPIYFDVDEVCDLQRLLCMSNPPSKCNIAASFLKERVMK